MHKAQGIFPLQGTVQPYAWGGFNFIPALLGKEHPAQQPCAEYWLGAHPNHPARVQLADGTLQPLDAFIAGQGAAVLGDATLEAFGRLPYLLKVLDVRQMLSIQVHPDLASARIGFAEENAKGIPLNAAHRNYKDDNHKPEFMVALSDFWLLHGFKPAGRLLEVLEAVPEFAFIAAAFEKGGYEAMYRLVMTLPQAEVNAVLQPLLARITPLYENGELLRQQEDFWAARAAATYGTNGNIDRGIFSIYLFNLLHLRKGEGVYQGAGMPHAYLEGQNVELMANSDNVLRAGLTDKHIDVAELLRHVRYEPTHPDVLGTAGAGAATGHFAVPAQEFELYQYQLEDASVVLEPWSAEILLVLEGSVHLSGAEGSIRVDRGEAAFVTAGATCTLQATGKATVYRAAVPKQR